MSDEVCWEVEATDTYAGEANYCWVKREVIKVPRGASRSLVLRRAKQAVSLNGVRGRVEDFGDSITFRPYRMAVVVFVNFKYD